MKLDKFEKQERKALKAEFSSVGGELFSWHGYGITVAVLPCAEMLGENSRFVRVAFSFCNFDGGDTFKRKTGEYLVLQRWEQHEMVCIPRKGRTNWDIAYEVAELCR
jgi:hypothetical protein